MSRSYDLFAGNFEKRLRNLALERLGVAAGEAVLEIGFGTGHSLEQIAKAVGEKGRVSGVDLSRGMLTVSRKRLDRAGLSERVELHCGDAAQLPYADEDFDAAFMSFTLELFDTPEIPIVLGEIKRVLKTGGRLGVVSLSREDGLSLMLRVYEWLHQRLPQYIDCRPIYIAQALQDAGFQIVHSEKESLWGLPAKIAVGVKAG
ncbi:MAG: methyltransferase domain-containing protein [Chloroflexi bacterium]|nr:methyltransferase domain-containing protein [Chloroflexota bacterium]